MTAMGLVDGNAMLNMVVNNKVVNMKDPPVLVKVLKGKKN